MTLDHVWGRLPITGEPVDSALVLGATLIALGALGTLTDAVGLVLCGLVTGAGVALVSRSGRGEAVIPNDPDTRETVSRA